MTHEELKFKESVLRECFKEKLEHLNVEGTETRSSTTAETMDIQATGLRMIGGK